MNNLKQLSYILRHNSPCKIDDYGWCLIEDLLPFINITRYQLEQIVINDNKNRFEILNNYIRACQGHTIKLKTPIIKEIDISHNIKFAYHATKEETWIKIQKDGYLMPMNRMHIHFATNINHMRNLPIVLSLNINKALENNIKLYLSTNNGASWTAVNNGLLPTTNYMSLAKINNCIFAGTASGVCLTTNNGSSWTVINTGLPINSGIYSLAASDTYLFAGNMFSGVWRRSLSEILGVNKNTLNNNITIYPNPTKDNLTIETNENTEQKIEILTLIGQTVYTSTINNKTIVNTSAFANGVYILKLSSDKETVVRKFVKE